MRLTNDGWLRIARLTMICLVALGWAIAARGQGVITTTVQGTVYLANGQPGGGTLTVSWPAFTTSAGQLVAADQTSMTIGSDGFVSINLAPNQGSTPAGQFYTAVYYMSDGTVNTQYWIVPAAAQATLAQVQAQLMPAAQAVQAVSKAYVDQAISEASQSSLGGAGGVLSGPLFLSGDPSQPLQAADKHYVDGQVATAVPLAGGNMSGPLSAPAVNGVEAPAANGLQTSLQTTMSAAGSNGAMEIPPTYAGTDTFTNPSGIRVTDLRTTGAQQIERSVKEFGAVCDGVTDDTAALQAAINYAQAHGVALTIPQGTCKTRTLNWHGESIRGLGKQVSALMGFPGQDVLATSPDNPNIQSYTRLHDLTIYVDQSQDVSCSQAEGRAAAGKCQLNRPMESNTIFSPGGNGLNGTAGTGAGWAVGNCAIAMQAATGAGGNGLKNAQIENLEIVATGTDPMATRYSGAHSTHTCGLYLAQWPQWSEFKNIDIRGLNTGVAIPALPVTAPAGLLSDSNRWQNITIQATHGFTVAAGCNGILDDVTAMAGNSAATGEPPTGIILDLPGTQEGWTVRNAVVIPNWNAVQPALTLTAAGGAITNVTVGADRGLGWDPYGTTVPLAFSGSCTAQANAALNSDGSIGAINLTQGGSGCSSTTSASVNAPGNWDTAAPVNLVGGQNMTFFAGSLLRGHGGYTVWNATGAQSYGTQVNGGGGNLPGGGTYPAFIANNSVGSTLQVDQFPGADFGVKLQACVNAVNTGFGGTCDARNFTGSQTMSANLTISIPNTTVLLPCATITTAKQVIVTAGTRNVALRGCAMRGGTAASGSQGGTAFAFSGTGAVFQVGDPTYAVDTPGFHMDNSVINTTGSTSAMAQGLIAYRTQEIDLEDMYFLGNQNQTGMTLDGTGNYAGGTIRSVQISGFQTAVNAIGHQAANPATTDWMNASTFVRLHIDCPTSNGSPIAGTIGIDLQQGDGNTFTGGDVEGCATALHLGLNAQNNTIIGLRNENSTKQVVADTGSSYNNWITGGTMFTGQLTDSGTRNSFQDSFHRSFNGINGDWYGSQQDATVTNHFRLGTGGGNERGLLNEYQTDYGYRWTEGLSDATGGEQFYQIQDQLNNVYRLSIGQYNNGQPSTNNQTVMNSAGTGAVVLNSTSNSGTGGVIFGSGGASPSTVATINNGGNAQFNGTLMVGSTAQSTGTMTVRNNADAEVDYYLWPGLTTSQKGSFTYKDWNGNSQWYMVKDASNNWALNSAPGGLDSFKAYQSTNSGDTYVNASNSTGHIRLNYESGSGAETDIYSGSSSNMVASFLGPASVKLPGLAASSGHNCLQIDNSGYITNTGIACGSGSGSGTVSTGNTGQIAYYTNSGTTIAGLSAVPVTAGGTGSTSAAGAVANLLPGVTADGNQGVSITGNVAANTITVSNAINGVPATEVVNLNNLHNATSVPVTEFGAVGNCTGSGSTTSCADNSTAIQNAINHCYTGLCSVYFPANPASTGQTVYYVASTINPKGVALSGPTGAGGPGDSGQAYMPVAVRGAAGKDVFATGDPTTLGSNWVAPLRSAQVRNLGIILDDSIDASSSGSNSFPNRLPGRTCYDGAIAASSNILTSATQCVFQGGDATQSIAVYGAGTQACPNGSGSTCLVTTIASYTSSGSVTLAAPATGTVTGAQVYLSVDGLSASQTIGNCAYAYDSWNPQAPSSPEGPLTGSFVDVMIATTDGSSVNNHTCGFFFQGRQGPYQTLWSHDSVAAVFPFVAAAAPGNSSGSSTEPSGSISNGIQDFNVIEHSWFVGTYSLITYGGGFESLRDDEVAYAEYGPSFLSAYGEENTAPSNWYIDIPEIELNYTTACAAGWTSFRLSGNENTVERLGSQYCSPANMTLQIDASDTSIKHFVNVSVNTVNTAGYRNSITQVGTNGQTTAWNDTGYGNNYTTGRNSGVLDGIQPMRNQYAGGNSASVGPASLGHNRTAFERTGDFIKAGGSSYYLNDFDLWMWPHELGNWSGGAEPTVVPDSSSTTGSAIQLSAGFTSELLGESNGTFWTVGSQIPAGKIRVFISAKAATPGTLFYFDAMYISGGTSHSLGCSYGSTPASLTSTYGVYYCDVDTTAYAGDAFIIHLGNGTGTTANVQIGWVGVRVWDTGTVTTSLQIAQTGPAITGNQGNGALVQHSTGTVTQGNLTSFDVNGNAIDSNVAASAVTAAQATASAALPANGASSSGSGISNMVSFPGSVTAQVSLAGRNTNGSVQCNLYATAGAGTSASPWTGWEPCITGAAAGARLHLPAGYYNTASGATFSVNNLTIEGDGPQQTIVTATAAMQYLLRPDGNVARQFTIRGLTLNANGHAQVALWDLNDTNFEHPVENVEAENAVVAGTGAVQFSGTGVVVQTCQLCSLHNIQAHNNAAKGIVFSGANGSQAVNLRAISNGDNGIEAHYCSSLDWGSTQTNCQVVMTLSATITPSQTIIPVVDAQYAQTSQKIAAPSGEHMLITAVTNTPNGNGQPVWTLTVTRGVDSTTAAAQTAGGVLQGVIVSTGVTGGPFSGAVQLVNVDSESNSGHAIWLDTATPSSVIGKWIENVANFHDGVRISGPLAMVENLRITGTATVSGANAAINILPGGQGAHVSEVYVGNNTGSTYFPTYIADPSITNGFVELGNSSGALLARTYLGSGTSALPEISVTGCGVYVSTGTVEFNCPFAASSLAINGGTPITSQSSANSQVVTCPAGGTGTQYCAANGTWQNQSSVTGTPTNTPPWLQFLGTGANGAYTCASGTCTKSAGVSNYTTFNVSSGATLDLTGGFNVIYATGACTVNGTIQSDITSGQVAYYAGGGSGGGGGGGTAAGAAASNVSVMPGVTPTSSIALAGGGTAGAASGGAGGSGNSTSSTASGWLGLLNSGTLNGAYWSGSPGGNGGSSGGAGGYEGPGFVLVCASITGTGAINMSGSNGGNAAANNQGAGGGGGAGQIVLSSQAAEMFSGLTLTASGGAGGTCLSYTGCGAGGTGGSAPISTFSGW